MNSHCLRAFLMLLFLIQGLVTIVAQANGVDSRFDEWIQRGLQEKDDSEYERAIDYFEKAESLAVAAKDDGRQAVALNHLSDSFLALQQNGTAKSRAELALHLAQTIGDQEQEGLALDNIGNAQFNVGDYQAAIDSFRQAARHLGRTRNRFAEAVALKDAGITCKYLNRWDEAFTLMQKALSGFESLKAQTQMVSALQNIAMGYNTLGLPEKAAPYFERAIQVSADLGNLEIQEGNHTRIGYVYLELHEPELALQHFQEALELNRQRKVPLIGWILSGLSDAEEDLGQLQWAIDDSTRALEANLAISPDVPDEHYGLAYLLKYQDPEKAAQHMREAIAIYRSHGASLGWMGFYRMGRGYYFLGDLNRAIESYQSAVEKLEQVRGDLASEETRTGFLGRYESLYQEMFEALEERWHREPGRHDDVRAFDLQERARARSLSEAIARTGAAKVVGDPEPLVLERVQQLLDPQTALVSYVISTQRIFAAVVTSKDLNIIRIDVPKERLSAQLQNFNELLTADPEGWQIVSRSLYDGIFRPVRSVLKPQITHLIMLPDGVLHYLPFEALLTDRNPIPRYLLQDYAVSYCPSATTLWLLKRPPAAGPRADLLAFADAWAGSADRLGEWERAWYREEDLRIGPLAYSAAEARSVERFARAGSRLFLGQQASEEMVKSFPLEEFRILHFATHGILSDRNPARSALILSASGREDGFLQAEEVYSLKLRSDLVVLSACGSARGRLQGGEGVQGIARAFLHAGSASVLASLWNVNDAGSAALMVSFYKQLALGQSKGDALRNAKRDMLANTGSKSPAVWAPFVLIGDDAQTVAISGPPWWLRYARTVATCSFLLALVLLVPNLREAVKKTTAGD